jgi:RHS repeat-associated protein
MVAFAENRICPSHGYKPLAELCALGVEKIIYRYDPETENYYVRNRYYPPTLGHWLTRDPIGTQGGINLYAYVGSSPVGNVDAAGLAGGSVLGMPIALPQHGPGPLHFWRGPIHDMGCSGGKCRYYVNTHYSQNLGTVYTNGWSPKGEGWREYVTPEFDALAMVTEAGAAVQMMLGGTTMHTALYAYDVKVSYVKTRVYTYICGTHYVTLAWESTTVKQVHFTFWAVGGIQNANLNLRLPGSGGGTLRNAVIGWDSKLLNFVISELGG